MEEKKEEKDRTNSAVKKTLHIVLHLLNNATAPTAAAAAAAMRTLQYSHFKTVFAETTSGVLKLKETLTMDELPFSAINENEFLTKSTFDDVLQLPCGRGDVVDVLAGPSDIGATIKESVGGFLANSLVQGAVNFGSQRKFMTRSSTIGSTISGVWEHGAQQTVAAEVMMENCRLSWFTKRQQLQPFLTVEVHDCRALDVPPVHFNTRGLLMDYASASAEKNAICTKGSTLTQRQTEPEIYRVTKRVFLTACCPLSRRRE